jgi:hypothetical protein
LSADAVPEDVELDPDEVVPAGGLLDVEGVSVDEDVAPRGDEVDAWAEVVPGSAVAADELASAPAVADAVDVGSAVSVVPAVAVVTFAVPVGHSVPVPAASC